MKNILKKIIKTVAQTLQSLPLTKKILRLFNIVRSFFLFIRTAKIFPATLAPAFKTNHQLLEIDITYDCDIKCLNCNRSCRQAPSKEAMTVEQIARFVKESLAAGRRWKVIRILGGEPSLHENVIEILQTIAEYKKYSPATTLIYSTNGLGTRARDILNKVPQEYIIENSGKTDAKHDFYPFNLAPKDEPLIKFVDCAHACCLTKRYGLGLTKHGYYHCAMAGGIDRVFGFNLGRQTLPAASDQMLEEKKVLCQYCGHFREMFKPGTTTEEIMSVSWKEAYEKYRVNPPKLDDY